MSSDSVAQITHGNMPALLYSQQPIDGLSATQTPIFAAESSIGTFRDGVLLTENGGGGLSGVLSGVVALDAGTLVVTSGGTLGVSGTAFASLPAFSGTPLSTAGSVVTQGGTEYLATVAQFAAAVLVQIAALPTTAPSVAGALWWDGGLLAQVPSGGASPETVTFGSVPSTGTVGTAVTGITATITNGSTAWVSLVSGGTEEAARVSFSGTSVPSLTPTVAGATVIQAFAASSGGSAIGTSGTITISSATSATIAITNLSPNPATAGSTVTLTGTFANGAPTGSSVAYAIDGGSAVAITGPSVITNSGSGATAAGSITGTFTAPAAGSHTVVLSAMTSGAAVTSSGASLTTRAAPSAPTITLTPGNNQISIAYTDGAANGSAITGRSLYRSTTAGAETLVTSGITSSPVVDASVTNGTTYYYRLSATNAVGEGAKSAEVSAAPSAPGVNLTFTGAAGAPTGTQVLSTFTGTGNAQFVRDGAGNLDFPTTASTRSLLTGAGIVADGTLDMVFSGTSRVIDILFRASGSNSTANGYLFTLAGNSGTGALYTCVNGAYTQLGASFIYTNTLDSFRLVISGTTYTLYTVTSGTATAAASFTDATFTANGYLGLGIATPPSPNTAISALTYH